MWLKCLRCALIVVAPVMSLKIQGVTDRSVDLKWEGSVVLTDFLVTYTPSSAGGRQRASSLPLPKGASIHTSCIFLPVSPSGVPFEFRIPAITSACTISGLEAGVEYNINVFAVINNSISVPASITVSTCKCTSPCCSKEMFSWEQKRCSTGDVFGVNLITAVCLTPCWTHTSSHVRYERIGDD